MTLGDAPDGSVVIIVDTALEAREREGRPIRVGMIGAGFMAQGLTNQIVNSVPGMELVAVYAPQLEQARRRRSTTPASEGRRRGDDSERARGRDPPSRGRS